MYKLLIIIQLGAGSHSSQIVGYQSAGDADQAVMAIEKQKTAYNVTVIKLY